MKPLKTCESLQPRPPALNSASVFVKPQLWTQLAEGSKHGLFGFRFSLHSANNVTTFFSVCGRNRRIIVVVGAAEKCGDVGGSEFRREDLISVLAGV